MTHDERVKLIKDMQDVLDAEIAQAKAPRDRIQALKAALAVERVMTWFGVELNLRNEGLIETLKNHNKDCGRSP
jgi:hypothetical protein